jgi:tetratricopeptide (TPR) repeat protein
MNTSSMICAGNCGAAPDWSRSSPRSSTLAFLAACLLRTGKTGPTIALLDKAIRLDPANKAVGWSYLRIGAAAVMRSRNDEAIAWLEKARVSLATTNLQTSDLSATYSWLASA